MLPPAVGEKKRELFLGGVLVVVEAKGLGGLEVPVGAAERWSSDMVEFAPTMLYMPRFLPPGMADMSFRSAMFWAMAARFTDRCSDQATMPLQTSTLRPKKAKMAPTHMKTVPSGRSDFCMKAAWEVSGTPTTGIPIPACEGRSDRKLLLPPAPLCVCEADDCVEVVTGRSVMKLPVLVGEAEDDWSSDVWVLLAWDVFWSVGFGDWVVCAEALVCLSVGWLGLGCADVLSSSLLSLGGGLFWARTAGAAKANTPARRIEGRMVASAVWRAAVEEQKGEDDAQGGWAERRTVRGVARLNTVVVLSQEVEAEEGEWRREGRFGVDGEGGCAGETSDWVTTGGEEGPRETRGEGPEEGIQEGVRVGD